MWDRDGHLLLSVAVIYGYVHIIKLLLELESPQMDRENYLIKSPLQIAVVQGDEAVIKSLLYSPNP
jgi:ankyrin repeat protein